MRTGQIADLSYRNYDGPLDQPVGTWWPIAKMQMRMGFKKRFFWLWAVASSWWYLVLLAVFYFVDALSTGMPAGGAGQAMFMTTIVWKDQFLNAFTIAQLFYFILALQQASGAIANDNKANALLVYLSKPCTKADYLFGKWLGVFLVITTVVAVPMLIFFAYCFLSYRSFGFVTQDPWLILRLIGVALVPGIFHASVSLGISSMFNQGRIAGAVNAGLYFLASFFASAMIGVRTGFVFNGQKAPPILDYLSYFSMEQMQVGMAKVLLNTTGSELFGNLGMGGGGRGGRGNQGIEQFLKPLPVPAVIPYTLIFFAICALFMFIAWRKVRAVEVVGR